MPREILKYHYHHHHQQIFNEIIQEKEELKSCHKYVAGGLLGR
jgi:hypothetical protein